MSAARHLHLVPSPGAEVIPLQQRHSNYSVLRHHVLTLVTTVPVIRHQASITVGHRAATNGERADLTAAVAAGQVEWMPLGDGTGHIARLTHHGRNALNLGGHDGPGGAA